MTLPNLDLSNVTPDKFIMWIAAALLGFVLWGVDAKVGAMREEHQALYSQIQILCVHGGKNALEQKECLTGKLSQKTLDELH